MASNTESGKGAGNKFLIKIAKPEDATQIRSMIQELADFVKLPDGPKITVKQAKKKVLKTETIANCFRHAKFVINAELSSDLERKAAHSFIAYHKETGEPAAMTIFYYAYSTWEGQIIHMEDLYVREKFRRNKIAVELVKAVVNYALDKGMKRVIWNVLDWNLGAIEFYKKLGATNLNEEGGWLTFKLGEEQMKNLVKTETFSSL